jgi:ribonuclease HIII
MLIAGSDEAGKGDYFGYIVVACVACEEVIISKLDVRDSKKLSEKRIWRLERDIKQGCIYSVTSISPKRYNQLHRDTGGKYNLNEILGWLHARAINKVLTKCKPTRVTVDKFGDETNVLRNIKGAEIRFITSGEVDPSVAAASILARAEFLRKHESLSKRIGVKLPLGSAHVKDAAREVVEKHGMRGLAEVAKLHFRVTKRL